MSSAFPTELLEKFSNITTENFGEMSDLINKFLNIEETTISQNDLNKLYSKAVTYKIITNWETQKQIDMPLLSEQAKSSYDTKQIDQKEVKNIHNKLMKINDISIIKYFNECCADNQIKEFVIAFNYLNGKTRVLHLNNIVNDKSTQNNFNNFITVTNEIEESVKKLSGEQTKEEQIEDQPVIPPDFDELFKDSKLRTLLNEQNENLDKQIKEQNELEEQKRLEEKERLAEQETTKKEEERIKREEEERKKIEEKINKLEKEKQIKIKQQEEEKKKQEEKEQEKEKEREEARKQKEIEEHEKIKQRIKEKEEKEKKELQKILDAKEAEKKRLEEENPGVTYIGGKKIKK